MLYIFLSYKDWSLPEPPNVMEQHETVTARAQGRDGYICSAGLESFTSATTVRVRASKAAVTDGPFAETKEVIAGYDVVECASREEAIACARRRMQLEAEALRDLPELSSALRARAETYAIEVRPLFVWG